MLELEDIRSGIVFAWIQFKLLHVFCDGKEMKGGQEEAKSCNLEGKEC
jgi:hypothetical protein